MVCRELKVTGCIRFFVRYKFPLNQQDSHHFAAFSGRSAYNSCSRAVISPAFHNSGTWSRGRHGAHLHVLSARGFGRCRRAHL